MRPIAGLLSFFTVAIATLAFWPSSLATQQVTAVRPAKVAQMQNLELEESLSHRPAYIPSEWGRLVSVQRLNETNVELFLQAENGEIFLVRLAQRGEYLYMDTSDKGGVALVIKRQP